MRFLGNKTKLLGELWSVLQEQGVEGGRLLDVFSGTCSVGIHFRTLGWEVYGNDVLWASYVRQRAFLARAEDVGGLDVAVERLNHVTPRRGLISRQFSEGGPAERLYYSRENGARIDGAWVELVRWLRDGEIREDDFYLLLALLIEAADRVANISGTYGAYLKKLNTNATKPLELRVPKPLDGPRGHARRGDAIEAARELEVDLLYADPPYNGRQYVKYYHLPEILAELHAVDDLDAYEEGLYGKTGLRGFEDRLSAFCRAGEVEAAFSDLVSAARAKHILVSYSSEGLLSRDQIEAALAAGGWLRIVLKKILYRRFRSDSTDRRTYSSDGVDEWMFYACR